MERGPGGRLAERRRRMEFSFLCFDQEYPNRLKGGMKVKSIKGIRVISNPDEAAFSLKFKRKRTKNK
jgi:hypothetical protein